MNDDELNESERRALDAWSTLTPPPGFADRIVASRALPQRAPRRWVAVVAIAGAAAAAAAALLLIERASGDDERGRLVATTRTTRHLGDRAIAVAEPDASLSWHIEDGGPATVEQTTGSVFYRVDRGGPFVVHTPAGAVRVTGTCFRIEVDPMNKKQLLASGAAGAALATVVLVTVYEGRVVAENRGARTELVAGNRATMTGDGRTIVGGEDPTAIARALPDEAKLTRDELLARTVTQRNEIARLKGRLAELDQGTRPSARYGDEPGRKWYDPSEERLKEWAAKCHVRSDEPGLSDWEPSTALGKNDRGLEESELSSYNAALSEVQQQWKVLVRALYLEATGDTQGAETLSIEAMRGEIEEKGAAKLDHANLLKQIAAERAGLAQPPVDLSKASPFERMMRTYMTLGDQAERALAKRLGPARASEIRGNSWGSRSDWEGCPE